MPNFVKFVCGLFAVSFVHGAGIALPSTSTNTSVILDYTMATSTRAVSPDGKLAIAVSGEPYSLRAWATIVDSVEGSTAQVWPIERSVEVLWQPNSAAFALTDHRFSNQSFVLSVGTKFQMDGSTLGISLEDLTPPIRAGFLDGVKRYYRTQYHTQEFDDSYSFHAKALRWLSNSSLLVGVSAVTSLKMPKGKVGQAAGVKGWFVAYIFDMPRRATAQVLTEDAVKARYGIDLATSMK